MPRIYIAEKQLMTEANKKTAAVLNLCMLFVMQMCSF